MPEITTLSGYKIKSKKIGLSSQVLKKWISLNSDSNWLKDQDAPWWYNERASLSFFAGAVWQSNGWSFEEFVNEKTPASKRQIQNIKGRCDILFCINDNPIIAEAKQLWLTLSGNIEKNVVNIKKSLSISCKEAKQNSGVGYPCLGMVFVVPQLNTSKKDQIDVFIKDLIEQLLTIDFTAIAWAFPKLARNLTPDTKNIDYIFPGVILIIKEAV